MAVGIAQRFIGKAKTSIQRVVFPEGTEPRMVRAVRRLKDEAICEPILLGDSSEVAQVAGDTGVSLDGIPVIDPDKSPDLGRYAAMYAKRRSLKESVARRVIRKPLAFGAAMVSAGDADG